MSSVERYTDAPAPVAYLPAAERTLVTWAQEADAAYGLAERMVGTSFCPQQFRGKPIEAAAAVLAGAEVGLSPLAALRSFDIIQGVAAPRALTLRAIAQAAGCQFQTVEEDDRKVTMRARRRGGEWETVTWTIQRAQQLGLTNKDNWKKQPQAMLVARATAELARRVAADRILGLGYAVEEQDYEEPAPPASKRTVSRRTKTEQSPKAVEEVSEDEFADRGIQDVGLPPLPGEDAPTPRQPSAGEEPLPSDRPGFITRAQLRMLHAMLNKVGLGDDRDGALRLYAKVGGREVESSKDLTRIEATRIIDYLVASEAEESEVVDDDPHPDEFDDALPYKDN